MTSLGMTRNPIFFANGRAQGKRTATKVQGLFPREYLEPLNLSFDVRF
jgi:hypothetical protein